MGFESRDYVRESRPPGGSGYGYGGPGASGYWAVKFLLIANIVVFILQTGFDTGRTAPVADRLKLKMATKITGEGEDLDFTPVKMENGRPPRELTREKLGAKQTIPDGSVVEPLASYGRDLTLVEWRGEYGVVPAESLKPAPLRSWQLVWRIVTYGFCHGNFQHILFNMLVLFFFGRNIEPIYGSKEFLLFFLGGVVVAGIGHLLLQSVMGQNIAAVGASGGVMAVVFLTAMIFPREKVLLMFVIPIELRFLAIGYAVFDLLGVFNPGSGVAHAAHLFGAAFGVAYKYYDWRILGFWTSLRGRFRSFKRTRRGKNVRLYEPEEPAAVEQPTPRTDLSHRVDELLEKISREGEASLTDSEREDLAEASRRLRER